MSTEAEEGAAPAAPAVDSPAMAKLNCGMLSVLGTLLAVGESLVTPELEG